MLIILFILSLKTITASNDSETICSLCNCKEKNIDCSSKNFTKIFNATILPMLNVNLFDFNSNGIIHLKPFPIMSVVRLTLRHNSIYEIDDAAFRNLMNLTELDLSYNHLTSDVMKSNIFMGDYAPGAFLPLKSLRVLKLSGNSLHTLKSNLFDHLPGLEVLLLDSNPLKLIDHSTAIALSSCSNLKVLDLSSTMIRSIPSTLLHAPKYLTTLNLSSNYFTQVPEALHNTHCLEELVLDENPIEKVTSFPSVSTLKILKLNSMPKLRSIESRSLSNLTNLQELYCSHNKFLKDIVADALAHLPEGEAEGQTWPPISKLHLSNNALSYLDIEFLSRWDKLVEVDIQINPWVCDCNNQWMLSTLLPIVNRSGITFTKGIMCHKPVEMQGFTFYELSQKKTKMRCLDFYGNHPERDAVILIGIFIGTLLTLPIVLFATIVIRRKLQMNIAFSKLPTHSNSFT